MKADQKAVIRFSPRNGEIILKQTQRHGRIERASFSPRNGEIILKKSVGVVRAELKAFQSPQWGNNSKGTCSP